MQQNVTFVKKYYQKSLLKMKIIEKIEKIETIFILKVNLEVQGIVYVIQEIMYLTKFLHFCTMDQTMIITLS